MTCGFDLVIDAALRVLLFVVFGYVLRCLGWFGVVLRLSIMF